MDQMKKQFVLADLIGSLCMGPAGAAERISDAAVSLSEVVLGAGLEPSERLSIHEVEAVVALLKYQLGVVQHELASCPEEKRVDLENQQLELEALIHTINSKMTLLSMQSQKTG